MKYYSLDDIKSRNCDYNFLISGRGTGKSTASIKPTWIETRFRALDDSIDINDDVETCYGIDIAYYDDRFVFGKRGTVPMEWSDFENGDDS